MKFSMNIVWLAKLGRMILMATRLTKFARAVLLGLENDAHAAFKNLADDLVSKVALDGKKCHAGMFGNCAVKSSLLLWLEGPQIFYFFLLARFAGNPLIRAKSHDF